MLMNSIFLSELASQLKMPIKATGRKCFDERFGLNRTALVKDLFPPAFLRGFQIVELVLRGFLFLI